MTFAPRCPGCGTPVAWEGNPTRPFCSDRCRLVDLGAWAAEQYRIPGREDESERDGDAEDEPGGDK